MNLGPSGPAPSTEQKTQLRTAIGAAPALGADDNYVTDAEKAALHSHDNAEALAAVSGTNTGDEDTESILEKLKGTEADPTRIGAEFMPDALSGEGVPNASGIAATATLDPVGTNNAVVFTAVTPGTAGNAINVLFNVLVYPESVSVSVVGNQIGVTAGVLSTAQNVIDAVNASPAASGLVTATNAPGSDGSNLVASVAATFLTGGTDGGESVTASHIGQHYRDTNTGIWYRWNGTVWELDAASVTIDQLEALDATAMKAYLASLGVVLNA